MTENVQISEEQIRTEVKLLIARVTEGDPAGIGDQASLKDDLGVDSLMAMELMVDMDKRFDLNIPENDFNDIKNVDDAVAVVQRHLRISSVALGGQ
jgi:acyl carrier protein